MNRRRLVDWRLFAAVGFLLLVSYVAWSGVQGHKDSEAKSDQVAALIAALKEQAEDAAVDRTTAAQGQRALLDDVEGLIGYTKALAGRQDAILDYLRVHGIHLPTRLVTAVPPPRIVTVPRGGQHTSSRPPASLPPHPAPMHPSTSSPGKSGSAPGHTKHHKKPKKHH